MNEVSPKGIPVLWSEPFVMVIPGVGVNPTLDACRKLSLELAMRQTHFNAVENGCEVSAKAVLYLDAIGWQIEPSE